MVWRWTFWCIPVILTPEGRGRGMTTSSTLAWSSVWPCLNNNNVFWLNMLSLSGILGWETYCLMPGSCTHENLLCQWTHLLFIYFFWTGDTVRSFCFPDLLPYWVGWKVWARLWSMSSVAEGHISSCKALRAEMLSACIEGWYPVGNFSTFGHYTKNWKIKPLVLHKVIGSPDFSPKSERTLGQLTCPVRVRTEVVVFGGRRVHCGSSESWPRCQLAVWCWA